MGSVLGMSVWYWVWEPEEQRGGNLEVISVSGCQGGFLEKGKDEKGLRERRTSSRWRELASSRTKGRSMPGCMGTWRKSASLEHGGSGGEGCPGQTGKGQGWGGSPEAINEKHS